MAELADALDSGSSEVTLMQVRFLLSAPRRRGLCIVRDDFSFHKSSFHTRRRSSFPQKGTLAAAVRF